jgi:ribosomal protein S18 acetylase RimI-like enzyme
MRPARVEDIPAIVELIRACELDADGVAEVVEGDVSFERHGFDEDLDTMLVFDRDELVAWAELYRRRAEADVRPSHRGRGIGSTLLRWSEDRGRELGEAAVNQTKTDANADARELFLAGGYEQTWVAWFIRMVIDEPPPPPEVPAGISIRPYAASDARDVHRVIDAAFCEWPGREPEPYEVWASMITGHANFRPEVSPLAFDGDELVGAVIASDYPDVGEGWISQLATKATHRHRGIAQVLLRSAFGSFYERGRTVVGVETDSRTGALGLYEKVGMHVVRQYTRYTKRIEGTEEAS